MSEFGELAERFLRVLAAERGASEHTVRAYGREVRAFAAYLETEVPGGVGAVEHLHIRAYLGSLYKRGGWARRARRGRWRRCGAGSNGWRRKGL